MDISRIIYCNKYSGLTELCSGGDYHNIKSLNIYGKEYIPERQLEKLILDKKVTYKCYGYGLNFLVSIANRLPENSIRILSLTFSILEMNDEHIIVNLAEKIEATKSKTSPSIVTLFENPSYAKIEFLKGRNISINGCVGDAAIVIYDVNQNGGIFYNTEEEIAPANLGRFALAIGFSLFVEMDGNWNKIIKDAEQHLMSAGEKLDNARKGNTELKEDNKLKENAIKNLSQQNNELNSMVEDMKNKLQSYQEELAKTRKWAYDILHFDKKGTEELDVSNEKDWEKFQSKVLELTEKMKEDSLKNDNKNRLKTIKKLCTKKYNKFDESDLAFLATGQYLLEVHKDDNMDFSPVLIAFSKCVEGVLADCLKKGYVIPEDERPMLGNSLAYIKKNPELLDLTQSQLITLVNQLNSFIKYRNKAAHKEGVSLGDVLQAKEIIFDSFEAFNRNYLLDFIYLKF